ncbi:MAG: hypothetical protein RLZ98_2511 [Pseudomonadota bacterium]|jgi:cyclopropane-fatty-acyl-phospholipid synthase
MFAPLKLLFETVVRKGEVLVTDASGKQYRFGDGSLPSVAISIADRTTERTLAFDPAMALGEAYMCGRLKVQAGSIYDLLAIALEGYRKARPPIILRALDRTRYIARRLSQLNTLSRSRRNVVHHYDIDDEIYRLFLDADLQYSCAYFPAPTASLEAAQRAKKRHIAAKLALQPGHQVLDIGSGWGGLALYLAGMSGASVTGITLSDNQLAVSRERAEQTGLSHLTHFELRDYRTIHRRFDRIVSVGMLEHVGIGHYDSYFEQVSKLLDDSGVALIHTIGRVDGPGTTNPFIARYIFPGGYFPALSEVLPAIERSGLIVTDVETLRLHYAETLKAWRQRFVERKDEVIALKSAEFYRMWEFYLAGSEAAFRFDNLVVFQLQLAKRLDSLPTTRDYMLDRERQLADEERRMTTPGRLAGE